MLLITYLKTPRKHDFPDPDFPSKQFNVEHLKSTEISSKILSPLLEKTDNPFK